MARLRFASWNSSALFHLVGARRAAKRRFGEEIARKVDVLFLRETHGDVHQVAALLPRLARSFIVHSSACERLAAGGVITLISREWVGVECEVMERAVVPGRVLRSRVRGGGRDLTLWNVHNFAIPMAERRRLEEDIGEDLEEAAAWPLERVVMVGGDFNFASTDEEGRAVGGLRDGQRLWERILETCTEIVPQACTHYYAPENKLSRIDRWFTSLPNWSLINMCVKASVSDDPTVLFKEGVSDHAALMVEFGVRASLPRGERPIPPSVFKAEKFQRVYSKFLEAFNLDSMDVVERWETHKLILREAAAIVRDYLVSCPLSGEGGELIVMNSVARAVTRSDDRLALRLAASNELAASMLVVGDGRPRLADPIAFRERISAVRRGAARDEEDGARRGGGRGAGEGGARKMGSRSAAIARLSKLWSPFSCRLVLNGIIARDEGGGRVHRREYDKGNALRDFWRPTFEGKKVKVEMGKMFANRWCGEYDFSGCRPPGVHEFAACVSRLPDSAPGADGLPFSAWRAAGMAGATTIAMVETHLRMGLRMPMEFNTSITVFIPKGEDENDRIEVLRSADEVRPISLKNSDNKIICSTMNFILRDTVAVHASPLQRGFVGGRRLLQNVIDLDAKARAIGHPVRAAGLPSLIFWDLAAAFPSVARSWLWEVLRRARLPHGALGVIAGIYFMNAALILEAGLPMFF